MTHEERAAVIIEELNTYHKLDPVAWLAEALRRFERDVRFEYQLVTTNAEYATFIRSHDRPPLAMAASVPIETKEKE